MEKHWKRAAIAPSSLLVDAVKNLIESSLRLVLVINDDEKLLGTISDGDIRRGLLRGLTLQSSIHEVLQNNPLVVPQGMGPTLIKQLMVANKIQQLPEVDDQYRVLGLHTWDEIQTPIALSSTMVIMAGGKGTRLRPHTENCPKPMLLVSGKPMLEHIIARARDEGFSSFIISLHYLPEVIRNYFGNGEKMGVRIEYICEETPLGTAGALALIGGGLNEPVIVTNGDLITDIKYADLLDFHNRSNAVATMAIRLFEWQNPFGVIQLDGFNIVGFEEKPTHRYHVNAGVYAISPEAVRHLNHGEACDMPVLFERLRGHSCKTLAYPMHEPWLDVGRHDDLQLANARCRDQ